MKIYFVHAILLITLFWNCTILGESEHDLAMLTCNGPSCESVAKWIDYRHEKPVNSITLKTDHFSIEVPNKAIKKIIYSKSDLMILYADDQLIYISESTGPEIGGLSPEMAYQYPEIIFTNTPKDTLTATAPEKLFWSTALASKPFYFQGATEVSYTKNNDLTYYLSNTRELGFTARSMVTNPKFKHLFLVIEAKQMDLNTFKQVVYSVK
jgi:hypothetical protein